MWLGQGHLDGSRPVGRHPHDALDGAQAGLMPPAQDDRFILDLRRTVWLPGQRRAVRVNEPAGPLRERGKQYLGQ